MLDKYVRIDGKLRAAHPYTYTHKVQEEFVDLYPERMHKWVEKFKEGEQKIRGWK